MKVEGKVIVVTGGGSGIGRELVLELIHRGATVVAIDVNENTLLETKELVNPHDRIRFSEHVLNITDQEEVEQLPDKVIELHGRVDGVINNAGIIQPFEKINRLKYGAIDRVIQVDFYGTLYMTKTFLPYLMNRPEAHIVNVSSMGGFLPVPGQAIYGASKAAVKLMTEALYAELLKSKVHVSLVFPGAIATNITKNSGLKMPDYGSKEAEKFKALPAKEAAKIIINGVEKNKFRILVGRDAKFMDFLSRLNPEYATKFIAKQMAALLKD